MVKSNLATVVVDFGTDLSNPREEAITKITIHHMAANMAADDCARMHRTGTRQASANYYIGSDGTICAGVSEDRRSWASASRWNDHRAITMEVADITYSPEWKISEAAYDAMIALCADICNRYGIEPHYDGTRDGSLTCHDMFIATECPGAYIKALLKSGQIEKDIKEKMGKKPDPNPGTLFRVQTGAYKNRKNAENHMKKVQASGFDTYMVKVDELYKVQVGAYRKKENAVAMTEALKAAGFESFITTKTGTAVAEYPAQRNPEEVAMEIIRGEGGWGNGLTREKRLRDAGYDPDEVQRIVNRLMQ